jgi:hypothetical protein
MVDPGSAQQDHDTTLHHVVGLDCMILEDVLFRVGFDAAGKVSIRGLSAIMVFMTRLIKGHNTGLPW